MKKEKIFWGLFFIAAAVFLIFSQMGMLKEVSILPLVFTVLLAAVMIKSIRYLSFAGILFPLAFLYMIYGEMLGIDVISWGTALVAALLGSIGMSFLFRPRWKKHYSYCRDHENKEAFEHIINKEDGQTINHANRFSSSIKYINSDDFQYALLESSFGAMKVYFDNAVIRGTNATIELNVSFAGMELFVPRDWNVIIQPHTSFGGIEEKNKSHSTGSPIVTIIGEVNFAGVEIMYV